MMRTRKLDSAVDTVKSAMIFARSRAIESRRMTNLTLLQQTDATHGAGMIITDYDALRETISGVATSGGTDSSHGNDWFVTDTSKPLSWSAANVWNANTPTGDTVGWYMGIGGSSYTSTISVDTSPPDPNNSGSRP